MYVNNQIIHFEITTEYIHMIMELKIADIIKRQLCLKWPKRKNIRKDDINICISFKENKSLIGRHAIINITLF